MTYNQVRATQDDGWTRGWAAALDEIEHQADQWDTPEHGDLGHVIAEALRCAADLAREVDPQYQHGRSRSRGRHTTAQRAPAH